MDSEVHEDVSDLLPTTPRCRTWTCAEGSGDDADAPRVTTLALDALAERWTKPTLVLNDVEVTVVGCTATVLWRTNELATSERPPRCAPV